MSEVLTSGMVGIPLDGPAPRPPLYGLPSVAIEVTPNPTERGGAVLTPYPDGMITDGEDEIGPLLGHDPCSEGSARVKEYPDALTIPAGFPSFTAYLGEVCTAYNIGNWSEWKARANLALAAREAWALERQLADASLSAAPSLNDGDVDLIAGTPAAAVAVAHLEAAIAATGIDGVLHLAKPVVSYLGASFFTASGGVLRTAAGTPVIAGSGYVGAADATGGAAPAAGQSWCYATGPILYARGATIFNSPDTIAEALDRDDNTVVYRAERDLWVGWDKQLQVAVLADWSP